MDDAADCSIHGGTVLLLEDEALIAVTLQADLEDAGYTVAGPFLSCASALEWLSDHRPDLAILDTVLKDGPCKEVALQLTRHGVPFLIYSGHSGDRNRLPELASATWVEKPATTQDLLKALGHLRTQSAVAS
jgi:DNA-binding response OmpR family regulator